MERAEMKISFSIKYSPLFFCLLLAVSSFADNQEVQNANRFDRKDLDKKESKSIKKSPTWAMISSALLPGGGQFYTEHYKKGLLFALAQGTLAGMTLYQHIKTEENWDRFESSGDVNDFNVYSDHYDKRRTLLFIDAGVWILSIADAYISAHFYEFERFSFSLTPNLTLSTAIHF